MGKYRILVMGVAALLLCSCSARTYDGGGYDLSEEQLLRPLTASVPLSSPTPTSTELETVLKEMLDLQAKKISSLPGAAANVSVRCRDTVQLKKPGTLPCFLKDADGTRYDDFAVDFVGVDNDEYELKMSAVTYWKHLDGVLS